MSTDESVDMAGIPDFCTREVPDGWQAAISAALPELRVVWNRNVSKFQVVHREPAVVDGLDGQALQGWQIIATFEPDVTVDWIIRQMRLREDFQANKLRAMGYTGATSADVIDAYLNDSDAILKKASDEIHEAAFDDYFDGPLARVRDEEAIWRKTVSRGLDQTRRHSARYKLVVPSSPKGIVVVKS